MPTLGLVRLDRLTSGHITRWHMALADAPRRVRSKTGATQVATRATPDTSEVRRARRSTANRIRTILVAALNRAHHNGHIASDAVWRKARPFRGVDAARTRWLSLDEATRLINACPPDFRRLVLSALFTGCRYGELTRLEIRDIELDAEAVHVRESKSGRPRHVPLDAEGLRFFRAIAAGRPAAQRAFLRDDGLPWGRAWQTRPMTHASAAAKLDEPASFHTLRHTYASLRVMAGMPLPAVAATLGHTSTRMVEQHYGHMAPSWLRDQVRETAIGISAGEAETTVTVLRPRMKLPVIDLGLGERDVG